MLSSVEVGTLITALGCGIGREEFNADKLRYHRIIIMTDADVDGSHIRTLLLTFFYRQMPELIERGYIYIAQPPLYKIKKGKQEQYVKDDASLNALLLSAAVNKAQLYVNPEAPPLSGPALEGLANEYMAVITAIQRLARRYDSELLEKMIYMPPLDTTALQDQAGMSSWFTELVERVNAGLGSGRRYECEPVPAAEDQPACVKLSRWTHGIVASEQSFSEDFFASAEYAHITSLGKQLDGLLSSGAYVQRGERRADVASFKQALTWLMDEARRGQSIQRYKGLGEMNPEQLWETTLDPENRRLLQVQIEDAVGSDDIFTTLMGDQVEPRREFIEKNALSVSNLDV